jgi:hypothetical protein
MDYPEERRKQIQADFREKISTAATNGHPVVLSIFFMSGHRAPDPEQFDKTVKHITAFLKFIDYRKLHAVSLGEENIFWKSRVAKPNQILVVFSLFVCYIDLKMQ